MAQFGDGYVGTSADSERIRRQEKQRADARKKFESLKKQSEDRIDSAGLRQFGASTSEALEHAFKNETVGLVTKAEFIQKRTTLQERIEEEMRKKVRDEEDVALREKERRKREKMANRPKLSFAAEEEEDADAGPAAAGTASEPSSTAAAATEAGAAAAVANSDAARVESGVGASSSGQGLMLPPPAKKPKFGKLGKDPTVATGFLPDKERQRQEEELRLQLRREWQAQQDKVKAEPLDITYSYWDGTGHRRNIVVPKGATIGQFLKGVRDQLAPTFRELRATSVDNLMYIKEDLIMPHHHTFYDLIINKARGKSGPLFSFNVHEDIRITNDASVEKTDSHAGKIVERHWYDKNKHIFPASRWEIYDPEKAYDSYTTHGQEVNAKPK